LLIILKIYIISFVYYSFIVSTATDLFWQS